jgi:SecD/SecF fusion protein
MAPLTKKLVNDAINQCFGRTIWTTFTVFIVVLIMYVWGGEGVRGFSFAMLIGVLTGAYSTLAIASPMLLSTGTGTPSGPREANPFQRKTRELDEGEPKLAEPAV